jgi:hypothetical protein
LASAPAQPLAPAKATPLVDVAAIDPLPQAPDVRSLSLSSSPVSTLDRPSNGAIGSGDDHPDDGAMLSDGEASKGLGSVTFQTADSLEANSPYVYEVLFTGVQSFVVASDIIDQLGHMPGVEETRLIEYEQDELIIAVTYHSQLPLGAMLKDRLSAVAQLIDQQGEHVHFVYHNAA